MEEQLIAEADSLGIFNQQAVAEQADKYTEALKKVEEEVSKKEKQRIEEGRPEQPVQAEKTELE